MQKIVQVHMLPTNTKSPLIKQLDAINHLIITPDYKWKLTHNWEYQHLYFTSEEEIKEGDWYMHSGEMIFRGDPKFDEGNNPNNSNPRVTDHNRKIVATTNPELWEIKHMDCNGQGCDICMKPFVHKIPLSFVKSYVQKQVKEVKLEYYEDEIKCRATTCYCFPLRNDKCTSYYETKGSLKLDSQEYVIISPVEEKMYTRDELKAGMNALFWFLRREVGGNIVKPGKINEWFDENYPK